jgi:hypothetical protein
MSGVFLGLLLVSCGSLPGNYSKNQSWLMPEKSTFRGSERRDIKLMGVSVDRAGGWDSLEKEVTILAPLYLWKKGFRVVGPNDTAAYAAYIHLHEREFAVGWHTRRSLAIAVQVWNSDSGSMSADDLLHMPPIAAGRIITIGNKSFASSKTTGKMLSRTINKTLGKLHGVKQGN